MNKIEYCYISAEGGHKEIGVEKLKQVGFNDYTNERHDLVRIGVVNKIGSRKIVYSVNHTKCREVLKSFLEQEIELNKTILNGL